MVRLFPFDPSVAQNLPALVTIQFGPHVVRFTTTGFNVLVEDGSAGVLYQPWPGADITGLQFPSDGSPANADVVMQAVVGSLIQPGYGLRGLLDNWPITIELFDTGQLSSGTFIVLSGTIGSVEEDTNGMLTIAANGQLRLAAERSMTERYALTGRETLGDDRCKIPICCSQEIAAYDIKRSTDYVPRLFADGTSGLILVSDCYGRVRTGSAGDVEDYANVYYECTTQGTTASSAPTYSATPGATITDGSAVFTCRDGWTRYARGHAVDEFNIQFTALPDSRASDATWYALGRVFIRSGDYGGFPAFDIAIWDPVNFIATLFLPVLVSSIPANTQFELVPGCDNTGTMCNARFNNIVNLRAEILVPPPEAIVGL